MAIGKRATALAGLMVLLSGSPISAASGDQLWQRKFSPVAGCPQLAANADSVFAYWWDNDYSGRSTVPKVRAFELETGQPLWTASGTPEFLPGGFEAPAIAATQEAVFVFEMVPGSKFVPSDVAAVHAYDAVSGELRWTEKLDDDRFVYFLNAIAADEDAVYAVGSRSSRGESRGAPPREVMILAWDSATGGLLWSDIFNLGGGFDRGFSVVLAAGLAVVAMEDLRPRGRSTGVVRAYRAESGRLLWSQETRIDQLCDLERHRDQVFVVGRSKGGRAQHSRAVGLDLRSGRTLWERRIKNYLQMRSIDASGRTAVVYGQDRPTAETHSTIRAFDRRTGRPLWRRDQADTFGLQAVADRGRVHTIGWLDPSFGLSLESYRARSGQLRWSYAPPSPESEDGGCQAIVVGNKLVALSEDGVRGFLRAFEP